VWNELWVALASDRVIPTVYFMISTIHTLLPNTHTSKSPSCLCIKDRQVPKSLHVYQGKDRVVGWYWGQFVQQRSPSYVTLQYETIRQLSCIPKTVISTAHLTDDEENALQYAAGFVVRCTRRKIAETHHP
jgi:hypothetical protein